MKKNAISLGAAALSLCFASFAQAQSPTPAQAHKEALAHCETLTAEAKTNCKRDAFASYNDKNRRHTAPNKQTLQQNRMARCQALPASARENCIAQMSNGHETKIYGSVEGGGILRRTTIEIPGQPSQAVTPAPISPSTSTPTTSPVR